MGKQSKQRLGPSRDARACAHSRVGGQTPPRIGAGRDIEWMGGEGSRKFWSAGVYSPSKIGARSAAVSEDGGGGVGD